MIATQLATDIRRICSDKGLRPYQLDLYHDVHNAWDAGHNNVLMVLPTGGGKTRVLSAIAKDHNGSSVMIAHRQELVGQISLALARNGVRHRIIGPKTVIKQVVNSHMIELGLSFYDPTARAAVAGVDTIMSWNGTGMDGDYYVQTLPDKTKLIYGPRVNGMWGSPLQCHDVPPDALQGKQPPKNMKDALRRFAQSVTLWITDEAHHCAANGGKRNKWMKATDLFTRAKGLGVTATPERADGAGLGSHHDGVFNIMVLGPSMRWLIEQGFLTEYRVFAPPSDLSDRMGAVRTSTTTGDFNVNEVRDAVEHSSLVAGDDNTKRVVGDVVQTYLNKFKGMLSVVFVPSVKASKTLEQQFIDSGVKAKALDGTTPDDERNNSIKRFAKREYTVLINVALFDEGFDLPAIEVVQDAYPTQSYGLFCQRFGRMLRLMDGKQYGIYSDHAGNVLRHGLPDAKREWSLDRRERRSASTDNSEALRVCMDHSDGAEGCYQYFERFLKVCPHCGLEIEPPKPSERNAPEQVDGDLYELDAETLAKMRGDIEAIDTPLQDAIESYRKRLIANHTPSAYVGTHTRRYAAKLEAQQNALAALREILAHWAGYHRHAGRSDSEIFRLFYLRFGVDWLTCQALDADKSLALSERVALDIGNV